MQGVQKNGELIAVKKLVASRPGFHMDFEIECHHLMKLKHPNVVRVLGYSYETHKICVESKTGSKSIFVEMTERLLCSEYLPKGSLDMYLSGMTISIMMQFTFLYKISPLLLRLLHFSLQEI
jgi:hypothetical protein